MADIEKKVEDLTLNAPAPAAAAPAAEKPQGKPKEKKSKKPAAEGSYPLEVLPSRFHFFPTHSAILRDVSQPCSGVPGLARPVDSSVESRSTDVR